MNRIFPHPDYAEDQPYSHTILTAHVLHRFTIPGAAFGVLIAGGSHALSARKLGQSWRPSEAILLRGSSTGVLVSLGLGALAVTGRMYGREEIEWQDRAWRLLENQGQNKQDIGGAVAIVLGAVYGAAFRKPLGIAAWRRVVGYAGVAGVVEVAAAGTWAALSH